ncbi:MAG TPA: hypothetical protein VF948_06460 [Methylomirabilota bacterium]
MSPVRLLDLAAIICGLAVLSSLVYWWWRPEELFLVLLGVLALRLLIAPVVVPSWRPRRVVVIGVIVYALLDSFIIVTRHWTLLTHALDLGYYVQLTWNLAPLVFVFPVGLDKADHLLVYAWAYPWRSNPEVVMKRDGDTVMITNGAGGPTYRYQVVAERGPHLLLRRL